MNNNIIKMRTPDGKFTLYGVLSIYDQEIADNWGWNEQTLAQYRACLQNTIIPHIGDHNTRSIEQYTSEYIEYVIARIEEHRRCCPESDYAPETLNRFRHIMEVTVYTAILHMLCPDVRKDSNAAIRNHVSGKGKPVRFFTPKDDLRIIRYIMDHVRSSGQMRGLMIMMCTRCRENEAAGLIWDDIRDNEADPQLLTVYFAETTQLNSSDPKLGGKSMNAPRQMTLTLEQSKFVRDLRKLLMEEWEKLGGRLSDFGKSRVAAKNENLWGACQSRHLSEAANMMFAELNLSDAMATLNLELAKAAVEYVENPDFYENAPERSATCYTLRRAASSFDRVLGIPMEYRKYLMGHATSGTIYSHCFVDADHQCIIARKCADRPGLNTIDTQVSPLNDVLELNGEYRNVISATCDNGRIVGMISTIEPGDRIHLNVSSTVPLKMNVKSCFLQPSDEYTWYINVKRKLHELYELEKEKN